MRWKGDFLLGDANYSADMLPNDVRKRVGDSKIYFGVRSDSTVDGQYALSFGARKQIVSLSKLLKKKKLAENQTVDDSSNRPI
ncbi:hypothetical protein HDU91_002969 [Kappamyces sp. JEL0680]|nr:hypothetical protein HDU91_002969 [Kappamyces sp. JEL0680]